MSVINEWALQHHKARPLCRLAEGSFWRWSGRLVLALIFLNSTLCFSAIWPTVYVLPNVGISPEFLCLVMLLAAWVALFGKPSLKALGVLAAIYLLMAVGRYGHVEEIASFVAYLAGPEAGYITGASLTIDGGFGA